MTNPQPTGETCPNPASGLTAGETALYKLKIENYKLKIAMKITLKKSVQWNGKIYRKFDEIELPETDVKKFVKNGWADAPDAAQNDTPPTTQTEQNSNGALDGMLSEAGYRIKLDQMKIPYSQTASREELAAIYENATKPVTTTAPTTK